MQFIENKNSQFKHDLDTVKEEDRLELHSFHRYYGKLIPAIPRTAIRNFTKKGDVVFDPFSGSGTTALEARYANRNFLGLEINPLSINMCKVKTFNYDVKILNQINIKLMENYDNDNDDVLDDEIPFCVNRDHWFRDFVQKDLVKIRRNIEKSASEYVRKNNEMYVMFFEMVLSAIVKQVSNADTAHVFPGISKRIRRLEAEGKIHKDVKKTFFTATKKRIKAIEECGIHDVESNFILCDSAKVDLKKYQNSVDLIVTNPPYISSVRYAETLKLELYWMKTVKNTKEYLDLQESMIGNDKIAKRDYLRAYHTKYDFINEEIDRMYKIDPKNAKVIYDFFTMMEKVIQNCALVLKSGKKLVMKISDSKIRKTAIHTGKYLSMIAEQNGFKFVEYFNDKINENSRSLLTSRNTYSDIILEDNIIIWERQ